MAHTICTATRSQNLTYLRDLWSFLMAPEPDMGSKLGRLFANETDGFGLANAFLSRIDLRAETEQFEVVYGPAASLMKGDTVPLSVTYCRKTIADPEGTVAVSDALAEGWEGDPAYERFGFGSYVGTTVTLDDELYGTLCFADAEPRGDQIADEELMLVEMFGQWVTYELNQWTGPPTHGTTRDDIDEWESPILPEIDTMMDVLGRPPRRRILLKLLETTAENGSVVLERPDGNDTTWIELQHAHLPKLEDAGYIEWDRDTNAVSSGPNFAEIEPLLRLLKGDTGEFSG